MFAFYSYKKKFVPSSLASVSFLSSVEDAILKKFRLFIFFLPIARVRIDTLHKDLVYYYGFDMVKT